MSQLGILILRIVTQSINILTKYNIVYRKFTEVNYAIARTRDRVLNSSKGFTDNVREFDPCHCHCHYAH